MNGEVGELEEVEEVEEVEDDILPDEFSEETVVLVDVADDDDVSDLSVELDVSQIVAKLDSADGTDSEHRRDVHRRLEELQEQKEVDENVDSTFNFNLDEDL